MSENTQDIKPEAICKCGKPMPKINASVEAKLDAGYPCPHATHKRPENPPVLDPEKFGRQWG